jgi:YD repeat-containing protein
MTRPHLSTAPSRYPQEHPGLSTTGRQRWSRSPDGRFTVTQVDGLGRVVATIQNYQTDSPGPTTPLDQDAITRTVYDAAGRVVQSVDPTGHVTADAYDLSDDLLSIATWCSLRAAAQQRTQARRSAPGTDAVG